MHAIVQFRRSTSWMPRHYRWVEMVFTAATCQWCISLCATYDISLNSYLFLFTFLNERKVTHLNSLMMMIIIIITPIQSMHPYEIYYAHFPDRLRGKPFFGEFSRLEDFSRIFPQFCTTGFFTWVGLWARLEWF